MPDLVTAQLIGPISTRIQPSGGWISLNLRELWDYRELIFFFVWRDLKVRYKQTILGVSWAVLQPFLTMVIFSLFFGRLAKVPSDGLPYPVFSYAALVPWTFFASSLTTASNSIISNSNMLKKIYFPRMTLPIAAVLSGLVDLFLALGVLLGMMLVYGLAPTANVVWVPAFLLLTLVTALGASLWLSALNVQFRDVRHTVPFLIQAWLFGTPVAYPSSLLPEPWKTVYGLNPMAGVVEGSRWALLGTDTAPGLILLVSTLVAIALLVSGAYYFRRMEKSFADVV
jgi:lipopolysaccharide transport system permease protein